MTFLAPLFAVLLPLALLPVVFHLFFRVRARRRVFPSLLFFLEADPRMSARRRLRDVLVLALRCLALALLLLALARPIRRGARGLGPVTLVAVVDNSASMAAAGQDGQTRLSRALAGAAALVDDPQVRLAAAVSTVRDPAAALPEGLTEDRAALRASLAALRPTHAAGEPRRALAEAVARAGGGARQAAEVHVFTDLQAADWGRPSPPLAWPAGVALLVHDVGRDEDAAGPVALLSLSAPRRRPVAGRAWQAVAILQNVGPSSVEVGLDISVEGSPDRRRETFAVPAGAVRAVRLPMRGLPAGLARVRVAADGPAAAPGAEGWMALPVSGGASVWLLGRAADHGLLAAALAPAGPGILTGLSAETRTAAELPEALRRGPPAMLAATARQLADPAVDAAASAYALAGGVLLVTPGRRDTDVPGTLPAWCGAAWGPPAASEAGFPLVVLEPGDAIWDDLRAADGSVRLPGALARRVAPLSAGTNALSLAGLADGRVALVRARLGRGRVYTMGFPFDPAWTTLPLRAAGLALAQALALTAPAATGTVTDVAAGEPLPLPLLAAPPAATARVAVRALAGDALRWQGPPADLAPAPRAGVYEIDAGSGVCWAAVRGDAAEAAVARVPAPQAPLLVGAPVRVFSYANGNGTVQSARAARSGSQLFAPLLAAALAAMLLETVVANRRSVRGRTTADGAAGPGRAGGRGEA